MTSKPRAYEEKAVADAGQSEAVAPEETSAPAPELVDAADAKKCADCKSTSVTVTVGEGAAERDYCDRCAPVNYGSAGTSAG